MSRVLACECGSYDLEITDADETTDDEGFVITFRENYRCKFCEGTGVFYADSSGDTHDSRMTGVLTTRDCP